MASKRTITTYVLLFVVLILLLMSSWWTDQYLLLSFGVVIVSIILIFVRFETRKIEARELVLLAILAAIAAVGRIPFASLPSVQPTTFVIMMSGIVFGAESGFIIGSVAALASNMILGQGPWTPWQMVAWGLVGYTAGLLRSRLTRTWSRIIFGVIWGFLFGWIMNLWGLLSFTQSGSVLDMKALLLYFTGSALFDMMHAISNIVFLLLFGNIWYNHLTRFKRKYGLLEK